MSDEEHLSAARYSLLSAQVSLRAAGMAGPAADIEIMLNKIRAAEFRIVRAARGISGETSE